MSIQKYHSFIKANIKPFLLLMVESFVLSLSGVWIAYFLQFIITPLQFCVDFLCGFGAAAGFAIAFTHQFPNLKKYVGLVLYAASVYFVSCYCYSYRKALELTALETIIRILRFCFVLGILILEYRLLLRFMRYLRLKIGQKCTSFH